MGSLRGHGYLFYVILHGVCVGGMTYIDIYFLFMRSLYLLRYHTNFCFIVLSLVVFIIIIILFYPAPSENSVFIIINIIMIAVSVCVILRP